MRNFLNDYHHESDLPIFDAVSSRRTVLWYSWMNQRL